MSVHPSGLIVLTGPSGSGKGVLKDHLLRKLALTAVVSTTTRLPRPGEIEGVHYFFTNWSEFVRRNARGEFVETNGYGGALYGVSYEALGIETGWKLVEVEVNGARAIRGKFKDTKSIFIVAPSREELRRRLIKETVQVRPDIEGRMAQAAVEVKAIGEFDYVIVNDKKDAAEKEIVILVRQIMGGGIPSQVVYHNTTMVNQIMAAFA